MAFYADALEDIFRFGDVVDGFEYVYSSLHEPHFDDPEHGKWHVTVERPRFSVVLTPCCSIEGSNMLIAPLRRLPHNLFRNPFLAEDPTRMNTHVDPDKSVPPIAWEKMSDEERNSREAKGPGYIFNQLFVFGEHKYLDRYDVPKQDPPVQTGFYMCDFKEAVRVETKIAQRNASPPSGMKILQLSVISRHHLRLKCGEFFARVPDEDKAIVVRAG